MSKKSRIIITGSAGFIGSALVERALEDNFKILGIDNHNDYYDPRLKDLRLNRFLNNKDYSHSKVSIEDRDSLFEIIDKFKPDTIVHLAAQAGVRFSIENPESYIQSNLVGFGNILEAARRNKTSHLVYASSSSVYGASTQMPFSVKNSSEHSISLYGATKKANEVMAHSYSYLYNIPTTGLRFFTVYGPWGRPDMALFKFAKAILNGESIEIYNNGNHKRDFTYIDDIIDGILSVIKKGHIRDEEWKSDEPLNDSSIAPWRILNLGNGNPVKLTKFIELIEQNLEIEANKKYLPMQPGDVIETYADISETRKLYEYSPKVSVEVGISRFIDWYKTYQL